jgi:hypothetical protein
LPYREKVGAGGKGTNAPASGIADVRYVPQTGLVADIRPMAALDPERSFSMTTGNHERVPGSSVVFIGGGNAVGINSCATLPDKKILN